MNKVYIVWATTEDCSQIHEICGTKEKAEQEKERLLTNIHLIKLDYKEQFETDYDEDYRLILEEDTTEDFDNQFYNFKCGYSYELSIEDVYIQEHNLV